MQRTTPFSFVVILAMLSGGCGGDDQRVKDDEPGNWPTPAPGPAGVGAGVRVFSGTAATLPDGIACTTEEGAEGDRWCGFLAWSSTGSRELLVVDVSQAMAGVAVSCDVPDPNCVLLTDHFGGSAADSHPTFFAGDTLVYYDDLLMAYAWRPGMDGGRLLASHSESLDVAYCTPASSGTAVACLGFPNEQADADVVVADLYAGAADGESEPLLAPIDSVIAATRADSGSVHRFNFDFPASGYVAWSGRPTPDGPEILKLASVTDPTSQITVANDVHEWDISPDGSAWLWLRAVDDQGTGTLQTALFPDGSDASDVLAGTYDYALDDDGSAVALTFDGDVVSILDPLGAPDDQRLLDSDVATLVALSDEGHIAYAKNLVGTRFGDLVVAKLDGSRACTLDTKANVPLNSVHFSPGAETALWAHANADHYDAFHSRLSDCSTVTLAPAITVLGWMGPGNAVFMDSVDSATSSGSLRFRNVGKNGEVHPAPATLIAEHVDSRASWGPGLLLYTVNAGGDEDGVYVRAFGM